MYSYHQRMYSFINLPLRSSLGCQSRITCHVSVSKDVPIISDNNLRVKLINYTSQLYRFSGYSIELLTRTA